MKAGMMLRPCGVTEQRFSKSHYVPRPLLAVGKSIINKIEIVFVHFT